MLQKGVAGIKYHFVFKRMEEGEEQTASEMVRRVFEKFIAHEYTSDGFTTFMQFINPATIHNRNFRGSSFTLLCRNKERIVGLLEVQNWEHILLLFVDEEFHGRGIARGLLNRVVEMCRKEGNTEKLTVKASPYGEPIYRKLGFVPSGPMQVKDGIKFRPMELWL